MGQRRLVGAEAEHALLRLDAHRHDAAGRLCLSFLWPGSQPANAIARETRLTPAAVTALIDRLEKRGFVRRKADPGESAPVQR